MSGQVEQVTPKLVVDTICPIVSSPTDNIITYQTALSVSVPSNVNSQFSGCTPTAESIAYVFTQAQIPSCCNGVQQTIKQVSASYN
jgi:hypothetical protein